MPIDTLYVKTSLFTASLFTFGKFVYIQKFYEMFFFLSMMNSIKNSFCAFLYSHQKLHMYIFTGSHQRVVTDAIDDDDNAGCHSTITRVI